MIILDFLFWSKFKATQHSNLHCPVKNIDVGLIERSFFAYLSSSEHGSAICYNILSNASLEIKNSCFFKCIGDQTGGAIYFDSKELKVTESCFDYCYSNEKKDNQYGNVIYSKTEDVSFQQNSFFFYGLRDSQAGDSTQYLSYSRICKIDYLNNTECSNPWGSAGPYFTSSSPQKSSANHVNVIRSAARHILSQVGSSPIDLHSFNKRICYHRPFRCSRCRYFL